MLVAIEDVTEREGARRRLAMSENYARGLFEHSPVSLWVEDFSGVKRLLDEVRERGIDDFRVFTDVHPEFVARCMSEIRVLDVNSHTLELFGAPDKATLLRSLSDVFRDEMQPHFREQLIDLWDGKLFQQREVVNYALDGTKLHLLLQFSVLPGHERDWSLVQVALTDITARKKAEAYLEYLGKHDVLTAPSTARSIVDELNRLERKGPQPVTIIIVDLNGLKTANDEFGHAAGDALLRRAGEVLGTLVEKPASVARIGGDEFAVLLPGTDAAGGEAVLESLAELIEVNNQFYPDRELSLSIGVATSRPGERLEAGGQARRHEHAPGQAAVLRGGQPRPAGKRRSIAFAACRVSSLLRSANALRRYRPIPPRSRSRVIATCRSGTTAAHFSRVSVVGAMMSGTMIGIVPALCAEAMPGLESSMATQACGRTPRRCAASR